ncbi:MAG TPA: hypothetical protein VF504_00490 [Solirubrobacterales bacterium]
MASDKQKKKSLREFLETEVWPLIPEEERGKSLSKEEVEDLLGLDEHGDFTKTDLPLVDLSESTEDEVLKKSRG